MLSATCGLLIYYPFLHKAMTEATSSTSWDAHVFALIAQVVSCTLKEGWKLMITCNRSTSDGPHTWLDCKCTNQISASISINQVQIAQTQLVWEICWTERYVEPSNAKQEICDSIKILLNFLKIEAKRQKLSINSQPGTKVACKLSQTSGSSYIKQQAIWSVSLSKVKHSDNDTFFAKSTK